MAGGETEGGYDDAVDGWTTFTHAAHPEIALSLCACPRAGGRVMPIYRSIDALLVPDAPSRIASRRTRPSGIGDEIAIQDRIHIITGGEGIVPHFTHRTPCDRVIRPTPRRVLSPRIGWVDLEFHATPRSNGRLRRDSFLIEDRRDGDDYCRASRRICALITYFVSFPSPVSNAWRG